MYALENYHPFVLFFYFITVVCLTMFFMHPVLLFVSLLASFVLFTAMRGLRGVGFSAVFFLVVALINPFFSHNGVTPLLFINGNPITLEALVYGIFMGMLLLSTLYWLRSFHTLMTEDKIMALFSGVFPKLALLLSMILHFVPQLVKKGKAIYAAQRRWAHGKTPKHFKAHKLWIAVLSALLTQALESAIDTADSMRARGYAAGRRRSAYPYKFRGKDIALLAFILLLAGCFLFFAWTGRATFYFYPQISQVDLSPASVFMYIAYALLMFMPVIVLVKGEIRWKYLRSGI